MLLCLPVTLCSSPAGCFSRCQATSRDCRSANTEWTAFAFSMCAAGLRPGHMRLKQPAAWTWISNLFQAGLEARCVNFSAGLFTRCSIKEVKYLWCERHRVCVKRQMSSKTDWVLVLARLFWCLCVCVCGRVFWHTHAQTSVLFLPLFFTLISLLEQHWHSQCSTPVDARTNTNVHARMHACQWRNISLFPPADLVPHRYAHRLNWFPTPSVLVAKQTPVWSWSVCVRLWHAPLLDTHCLVWESFVGHVPGLGYSTLRADAKAVEVTEQIIQNKAANILLSHRTLCLFHISVVILQISTFFDKVFELWGLTCLFWTSLDFSKPCDKSQSKDGATSSC